MTVLLRPTLTVQATPDYSDGDSIGPLVEISGVARRASEAGLITRFLLRSLISPGVQMFAHLFDSNPSASTFTDNAAMVLNSADRDKILKTFAIASSDWVSPKGVNPWYSVELIGVSPAVPYLAFRGGQSLYLALEADGTINYGSTGDLSMIMSIEG